MKAETIQQQAEILENKDFLADWSPVIPVQPEGAGVPIFCIAGKGGNPLRFRMLAELIGTKYPIYFMQSRGLDGKVRPYHKISDIAADYIQEIKHFAPSGPYHLIGSSFGGLVAYEMAAQLSQEDIGVVALLDTFGPEFMHRKRNFSSSFSKLVRFLNKHLRLIFQSDTQSRKEYFRYYRDFIPFELKKMVSRITYRNTSNEIKRLPQELIRVERANLSAAKLYQPSEYPGEIVLLRAKHQHEQNKNDPFLGWGKIPIANLIIHEVNSHHGDILFHPAILEVYEILKPYLEKYDHMN